MTRDEAIEAVRVAVKQQRRENEINLAELLVDALFALGVLKLEDPPLNTAALGREAFGVRNIAPPCQIPQESGS